MNIKLIYEEEKQVAFNVPYSVCNVPYSCSFHCSVKNNYKEYWLSKCKHGCLCLQNNILNIRMSPSLFSSSLISYIEAPSKKLYKKNK